MYIYIYTNIYMNIEYVFSVNRDQEFCEQNRKNVLIYCVWRIDKNDTM